MSLTILCTPYASVLGVLRQAYSIAQAPTKGRAITVVLTGFARIEDADLLLAGIYVDSTEVNILITATANKKFAAGFSG